LNDIIKQIFVIFVYFVAMKNTSQKMSARNLALTLLIVLLIISPASAQFKDAETDGVKMGDATTLRWRAGVMLSAVGGTCLGLNCYVPVPTEWPEQQVRTVNEEVSPGVKIDYKTVNSTVKIMVIKIAQLPAGQEVTAAVTTEIKRRPIYPPDEVDIFSLPDAKKIGIDIRQYLTPSPKIESRDAKIRSQAKEIVAEHEKAWEKVEAIYDWVRSHVKYKEGAPLNGAVAAMKDGTGDCEDMTSLFIALCRAADIPARTVWVPGHCYPEFYLVDNDGKGHWFPCQISGAREFGGILENRPILQKGDNFKPLFGKSERQRYMSEMINGTQATGAGKPRYKFIKELLEGEKK
jgi:hypothetical protein